MIFLVIPNLTETSTRSKTSTPGRRSWYQVYGMHRTIHKGTDAQRRLLPSTDRGRAAAGLDSAGRLRKDAAYYNRRRTHNPLMGVHSPDRIAQTRKLAAKIAIRKAADLRTHNSKGFKLP